MRYRIYELGSCGEIVSGADLSALHDEQSIAEAANHVNRCGLEIWQGNRMVAVISPPKPRIDDVRPPTSLLLRPPPTVMF
jgi:hypothetical protein